MRTSRCSRIVSVVLARSRSSAIVSRSTRAKARNAATASSEAVAREIGRQRLAKFLPHLREQEQRNRLRREQRRISDQRLGCRMQLSGFVDGEREGLRDSELVVVVKRRVLFGVEQLDRRRREAGRVIGEADGEPLAVGGGLLVGEGQAAERLGKR